LAANAKAVCLETFSPIPARRPGAPPGAIAGFWLRNPARLRPDREFPALVDLRQCDAVSPDNIDTVKRHKRPRWTMYAKVTRYRTKPGMAAEAVALMEQMKGQIMSLPGLKQFLNIMDEDGAGYVIGIWTDKEAAYANADREEQMWAAYSDHLEPVEAAQGHEVRANWTA
jgi:heme-degrading monooxygenase HmoA